MITALAELLRGSSRTHALGGRLLRDRDVVIPGGVGAGLRFNAGDSNPDYALGRNETSVQRALGRVLRPAGVFYDIGANVGFFTVIGARLGGPEGRVLAFEPVPENASLVRRNARLNGFTNVVVHEAAVSRASGEALLLLAHYSGGAALAEATTPPDLKGSLRVATVTIDELVERQGAPPPDVVKIDVEGAELAVLEGMARTLARHRPAILFEVDAADAETCAARAKACGDWLRARGYEIERLADCYPPGAWFVGNFLATPGRAVDGPGAGPA